MSIYHDILLDQQQLYLTNVELPQSNRSFRAKLNILCKKFIDDNVQIPPTFFIVNTDDGAGVHWYTVVLELNGDAGAQREQ